MGEKQTSQTQQNGAGPWREAAESHAARMQALYDQLARYEAETAERARQAVDEMARLTKETIDHATRLQAEWRRLSIEAIQRATDLASRASL
jgi:RNase P subunit RPR2